MTTNTEVERSSDKKEKEPTNVSFLSDKNPDSDEARELLIDNNIKFWERVEGEDFSNERLKVLLPAIMFASEGDFEGLDEIKKYIEIVTQRPSPG